MKRFKPISVICTLSVLACQIAGCSSDSVQPDISVGDETNSVSSVISSVEEPDVSSTTSDREPDVSTVTSEKEPEAGTVTSGKEPEVDTVTSDKEPEVDTVTSDKEPNVSTVTSGKEPNVSTVTSGKEPNVSTTTSGKEPNVSTVTSEEETTADTSVTSEKEVYHPDEPSKYSLSNSNADEGAKRTYSYISENFGKLMISCQQESTWMGSPDYEMNYIERVTGKLPAMRGLDFMNDDFNGVVQRSKEWHNKGGIVTICWHTGINGKGYQESLNDIPDFDKLLTEGTDEYNKMIANWDKAARALQELRDAGVTVLWRPFHEFDGEWFWWGKGGADNFKKLWIMMYERFTYEFDLTNLIWVLGYSGDVKSGWYPGDEYCDIIGSDTYDNSVNRKGWRLLNRVTENKPLAFHECGNVPSVEEFEKNEVIWSWFMIWHTDFIKNNDKSNLKAVYNHEKVITLDELPKL